MSYSGDPTIIEKNVYLLHTLYEQLTRVKIKALLFTINAQFSFNLSVQQNAIRQLSAITIRKCIFIDRSNQNFALCRI